MEPDERSREASYVAKNEGPGDFSPGPSYVRSRMR